jgi:hypothetical protein
MQLYEHRCRIKLFRSRLLIGIGLKFGADPDPDPQHWYLRVKVFSKSEALVLEQYPVPNIQRPSTYVKIIYKLKIYPLLLSPHKQPSTKSSR